LSDIHEAFDIRGRRVLTAIRACLLALMLLLVEVFQSTLDFIVACSIVTVV
jgi:hypothetical protein